MITFPGAGSGDWILTGIRGAAGILTSGCHVELLNPICVTHQQCRPETGHPDLFAPPAWTGLPPVQSLQDRGCSFHQPEVMASWLVTHPRRNDSIRDDKTTDVGTDAHRGIFLKPV